MTTFGVIFDMDGVLFDTETIALECWGAAAETLGLSGCGNSSPEPPDEPVETPEPQGSVYDEACTDENGIPTAPGKANTSRPYSWAIRQVISPPPL